MAQSMVCLAIALCLLCSTSTNTVFGIKPHFTSEPNKQIVTYQDEKVNFTWKLSNHSFNSLYFGIWQEKYGILGNTILSIVRNGSETPIYTSDKKEMEEYRGRVRWAGDLSTGVVRFELTNIKQTDQKYYGIEIEFNDDAMTEVSGFTQLIVKARSVFTSAPSDITQPVHGLASFFWVYSLTGEDQGSLSALVFGIYRKDTFKSLCTIQIQDKTVSSSNCSTGVRKAVVRYSSSSPTSMAKFTLDNLSPQDEGIYSLRLEGTRELMENKTRLFVRGTKPHFTSEPDKQIVKFLAETVTFTWKLSNHSFNRLYFGTWQADHGTFGKSIMSIVRNGSETPIYTSDKKEMEEYRGRVRWSGDLSTGVASFELANIKQTDQKYYGIEVEFDDAMMTEISGFTQLVVKSKSVIAKGFGIKPHFTSEPEKQIVKYQDEKVTFNWKLSNHSFNSLYFGIWQEKYGILGKSIMSIVRNGSETPIYTSDKKEVEEYRGRVRWAGDLSTGVVSFELTNIKQTDQKYYGIEIEFDDAMMTEISSFTQLVVKSKSEDKEETNPCEVNNGGCSHVCDFSSVTKSHTCKCPTGMDLSSDGKTCRVVVSPLTTVPPSPTSGADVDKKPSVKTFLFILVTSIITVL